VDQVLAVEQSGQTQWYLADHQGSVRQIVDNAGNLLNQIGYDSFGNITSQTNPSVTFRFGYTGREWDGETGQYYYRARYYDAGVGRFLSQDPIGFNAGDANLYRYVGNGPTNATDPWGLWGKVLAQDRYIQLSDGRTFRDFNGVIQLRSQSGIPFGYPFPGNSEPVLDGRTVLTDRTRAWIEWQENEPKTPRQQLPWGGKLATDDRGHITPRELGGSHRRFNIFAQNAIINGGRYRTFMEEVRSRLDRQGQAYRADLERWEQERRSIDWFGNQVPCLRPKPQAPQVAIYYDFEFHSNNRPAGASPFRPDFFRVSVTFSDGTTGGGSFSNSPAAVGGVGNQNRGVTWDYWFYP
jgi:RHS repeat-associated protein